MILQFLKIWTSQCHICLHIRVKEGRHLHVNTSFWYISCFCCFRSCQLAKNTITAQNFVKDKLPILCPGWISEHLRTNHHLTPSWSSGIHKVHLKKKAPALKWNWKCPPSEFAASWPTSQEWTPTSKFAGTSSQVSELNTFSWTRWSFCGESDQVVLTQWLPYTLHGFNSPVSTGLQHHSQIQKSQIAKTVAWPFEFSQLLHAKWENHLTTE